MGKIKKIVLLFFIWRALLFLPLALSPIIPYRTGYDYTSIWKFTKAYAPVNSPLLSPWANFDGVHYLSIAGNGYTKDGSNSRFFPLYPMLIHVSSNNSQAFSIVPFFAALLISNFSFLLALIVFYKLLLLDFKEDVAFKTILFLLVFPTSFFFASIYAESLFLLLVLSSFYFARKKQWTKASVLGMFLSATRLVGIFMLPTLFIEGLKSEQNRTKIISLVLTLLGIVGYAIFNFLNFRDPLYFFKSQGLLANGRSVSSVILFPQTLFRYLKILLTSSHNFEWWIAIFELSIFLFVSYLLYVAYKKKVRLSYLVFSLLAFLLPVSSGTFTGLPRYVLVLFPIFIAINFLKKEFQITYVIISAVLLFVLLFFFSRGYLIA